MSWIKEKLNMNELKSSVQVNKLIIIDTRSSKTQRTIPNDHHEDEPRWNLNSTEENRKRKKKWWSRFRFHDFDWITYLSRLKEMYGIWKRCAAAYDGPRNTRLMYICLMLVRFYCLILIHIRMVDFLGWAP